MTETTLHAAPIAGRVSHASDAKLTRTQVLALLRKLATDDEFRTRFETKPAMALTEIGMSPQAIIELNASCLQSRGLASKDMFHEALIKMDEEALFVAAVMAVPHMAFSPK